MLKVILPPFSMIETTARIIRVTPMQKTPAEFHVATQFIELGGDEQELIIRHILHVQAERLRARKLRSECGAQTPSGGNGHLRDLFRGGESSVEELLTRHRRQ